MKFHLRSLVRAEIRTRMSEQDVRQNGADEVHGIADAGEDIVIARPPEDDLPPFVPRPDPNPR